MVDLFRFISDKKSEMQSFGEREEPNETQGNSFPTKILELDTKNILWRERNKTIGAGKRVICRCVMNIVISCHHFGAQTNGWIGGCFVNLLKSGWIMG